MLWLIWIVMLLLVPAAAGVQVWFQLHREPADGPITSNSAGSGEPPRAQPSK